MSRGPHSIEIAPFGGRVRVRADGEMLADSAHALMLRESGLPPVFYLPRGDVRIDRLAASATTSHCPFKGDAVYFHVAAAALDQPDIAWSYEAPLPGVAAIAGHIAFYADRVEIETVPFG